MNGLKEIINAHPFFRGMKPQYMEILAYGATAAKIKPEQIQLDQA